jgi:HSP20 family protein
MVFGYPVSRHPLHQLRDEVDRIWNGILAPTAEVLFSPQARNQPAANVWEQGEALLVEMELPGVKSDQLDISVVGGELTVKVNRPEETPEGITYHRRERPVGSFSRVLRLPLEVNADKVEAELHDGILLITLPKAESAKPRKINVSGA